MPCIALAVAMKKAGALNKMVKRPFCGMARRGKHLTQKRLKEK